MDMGEGSLGSLPEVVLEELTEAGRLAMLALERWNSGDRHGALKAIMRVSQTAEAAAASLNTLVELGKAAERARAEEERRRLENIASEWWG
ncbi:hypothetical protein ACIRVF_31765 [Kitasatospora sp. NPDC101157]|uniref:hypothetical protein n=1 Tax=Kitasatospora sp. NPDC101157 TaxID=3364098 RepID=UPI00381DD769